MPIVVDGVVYLWSDGILYALNAGNGMTLWKTGMVDSGIHGLAVG
jgi:outer membrane protein assembly factor BamB